jgi:hypothetical protein
MTALADGSEAWRDVKIPNAEHPIAIDADTVQVVARVGDTVIADSPSALILRESGYAPVYCFRLSSVVAGTRRPSSTETYCPYKGDASYYDIVLPTVRFIRMQSGRTGIRTRQSRPSPAGSPSTPTEFRSRISPE